MLRYSLDLVPSLNHVDVSQDSDKIINKYWYVNPLIQKRLVDDCSNSTAVLDIGGGPFPFPGATHVIDAVPGPNVATLDIDHEPNPATDKFFDFVYCRHTLEDIQNPLFVFQELVRVAKRGYIETPSPLVEVTRGVDGDDSKHRGYIHHRYIIWSNRETNTLHCLPKYPILEHITFNLDFLQKSVALLNKYSVYWNNYYTWTNNPSIVVYRHGINMDITKDYVNLITRAINESMEYTNYFVNNHLNTSSNY